ncbi:MAG: zinc ribbon domain-containing protein [Desulfovibrionales bacterium]|nr:zinc ribbon domain-containing protein [Desulfovibrionales bacterium]
MPIYEFQCQTCGFCFEEILPASNDTLPECPHCGTNEAVAKQISACTVRGNVTAAASCTPRGGFS